MWKLKSTHLKNQLFKKETTREIREYFEINGS